MKKYKPHRHNIKGKGNKDQFDFNTEISFAIQECQQQILRGNIDDLSANLTSIATKLKKRNKLIELADQSPAGWPIVQEHEQDPMESDSDNTQKNRQAKQRAIRKKKGKTPASFTQSSRSTISEAPSLPFSKMDILCQSLQKQNLNTMQITHSTIYSTILSTIFSDLPERPKVQIPAWVAENKVTGEKTIQQFNSTTKQTELEDIILKKIITKFEKVNKSFNSLKPLLSKVLTKAKENKTKTYMGNLGNPVSRG